jgi:hypothetical protein
VEATGVGDVPGDVGDGAAEDGGAVGVALVPEVGVGEGEEAAWDGVADGVGVGVCAEAAT